MRKLLCCSGALLWLLSSGCGAKDASPRDASADLPDPDAYKYTTGEPPPDLPRRDTPAADQGARDAAVSSDKGSGSVHLAPFLLTFDKTGENLSGTRGWQWGFINFKASVNCTGVPAAPSKGHSGMGMWGTKLNDCFDNLDNAADNCSNKDPSDDSVLTLKVKLPFSMSKAALTYWEWVDFSPEFDWSEVRINNKVITQACNGSSRKSAWVQKTIQLDSYIGQAITIQFHFMATSVINHAGWYLDDIAISG